MKIRRNIICFITCLLALSTLFGCKSVELVVLETTAVDISATTDSEIINESISTPEPSCTIETTEVSPIEFTITASEAISDSLKDTDVVELPQLPADWFVDDDVEERTEIIQTEAPTISTIVPTEINQESVPVVTEETVPNGETQPTNESISSMDTPLNTTEPVQLETPIPSQNDTPIIENGGFDD